MTKMAKFVPREKMSKKERKKYDSQNRNDWGEVRPFTRKFEDKRRIGARNKKDFIEYFE